MGMGCGPGSGERKQGGLGNCKNGMWGCAGEAGRWGLGSAQERAAAEARARSAGARLHAQGLDRLARQRVRAEEKEEVEQEQLEDLSTGRYSLQVVSSL